MEKASKFYYKKYEWSLENDDLLIRFIFSADDKYTFEPSLRVEKVNKDVVNKNKDSVDNLVFNIGLVEILSYWKAFIAPTIVVECGYLDDWQKAWWKDLLINGMGQFFYENNIDFTKDNFVDLQVLAPEKSKPVLARKASDSLLIPVGGGKDSLVTLEILSKSEFDVSAFVINPTKASKDAVTISGVKNITVERQLDQRLIELNKEGFYNGHTPFTALLSFVSIFAATLNQNGTVVFSNEASSNEENTTYLGKKVNHQYSKTFEFENKFREYNEKYLSDIEYFSFLRPLYDLQITKIFSKFESFHKIFRSCNVGQSKDMWCGSCPKCLSTYILLLPFLKEKTKDIFGKDMLADDSLKNLLRTLVSEDEVKPFECVGTREELKAALGMTEMKGILESWNEDNNLPGIFEKTLKKYL